VSTGGLHVAIIMDGNGRWAVRRDRARIEGHRAGGEAVGRTVEAAPALGIGTLTLYAFSADNWRRPSGEVTALMELFERYLAAESDRCRERNVRVSVIGRRDRLAPGLVVAIERAEQITARCRGLHLRLAVDYSARDAILEAARAAAPRDVASRGAFARRIERAIHSRGAVPEVDLLIRTGGEQRISDFLLWEIAYAELWFIERAWPDFEAADLAAALDAFRSRQRRFGGLPG
jgi:undecaprenyl diphosphate synthase